MPKKLDKYLSFIPQEQRDTLFGSITDVVAYPRGDPIREGVISGTYPPCLLFHLSNFLNYNIAYDDTMKIMIIAATALSVIPIFLALLMPNWYLGDTQNAVDEADLTGETLHDEEHRRED